MLYVSIDLETTGLDPNACQVIEFAAVIEDTLNPLPYEELPKFSKLVLHDSVQGELYAVNMNAAIFKELNDAKEGDGSYCEVDELYGEFEKFLTEHNVIDINDRKRRAVTVAGKNFAGFDKKFLDKLPGFNGTHPSGEGKVFHFRHRVIDPASMYWNPKLDDTLPDMQLCKERAGLDPFVKHRALGDAWDVIQLVRAKFN